MQLEPIEVALSYMYVGLDSWTWLLINLVKGQAAQQQHTYRNV